MLYPEVLGKIRNIVLSSGLEIVEETIREQRGVLFVKFLVDFPFGGVDIGTCERVNRQISNYLDSVPDLVPDYSVEISSPGLDRKLRDYDDFKRVRGQKLEVLLSEKVSGKGQWQGVLREIDEGKIVLSVSRGKSDIMVEIPYEKIIYGRIVL